MPQIQPPAACNWRRMVGRAAKLGVADIALKAAQPLAMMRLLSLESGASLVTLPLNDRPARTPYCSIARADLADILIEAATATGLVEVTETRLTALTPAEDKISFSLEKGAATDADWLIGCDGQNGLCRQHIEADDPVPRHHRRDALRLVLQRKPFRVAAGQQQSGSVVVAISCIIPCLMAVSISSPWSSLRHNRLNMLQRCWPASNNLPILLIRCVR